MVRTWPWGGGGRGGFSERDGDNECQDELVREGGLSKWERSSQGEFARSWGLILLAAVGRKPKPSRRTDGGKKWGYVTPRKKPEDAPAPQGGKKGRTSVPGGKEDDLGFKGVGLAESVVKNGGGLPPPGSWGKEF